MWAAPCDMPLTADSTRHVRAQRAGRRERVRARRAYLHYRTALRQRRVSRILENGRYAALVVVVVVVAECSRSSLVARNQRTHAPVEVVYARAARQEKRISDELAVRDTCLSRHALTAVVTPLLPRQVVLDGFGECQWSG